MAYESLLTTGLLQVDCQLFVIHRLAAKDKIQDGLVQQTCYRLIKLSFQTC